jgi:hypothetical protein
MAVILIMFVETKSTPFVTITIKVFQKFHTISGNKVSKKP